MKKIARMGVTHGLSPHRAKGAVVRGSRSESCEREISKEMRWNLINEIKDHWEGGGRMILGISPYKKVSKRKRQNND